MTDMRQSLEKDTRWNDTYHFHHQKYQRALKLHLLVLAHDPA
jgi:hypothetical protein